MKEILWPLFLKEAEIIQAFNSTSRFLNNLLNIDNPFFKGMEGRIYPLELQLNKAKASDTEAPFFIFIHLFQNHPKFMISAITLILTKYFFRFWTGTFPVLPLTVFTFLTLFDLLECLVM